MSDEWWDQQQLFANPADLREDVVAGEEAKAKGQSDAMKAQRVEIWKSLADGWLERVDRGGHFTMDDVVRNCGLPDHGANRNNVLGAWVSGQVKKGTIEWTGEMIRSERVTRHAGLVRIWRKV